MAQNTAHRNAAPERSDTQDASFQYESPILAAVHETMEGLYEMGLVDESKMSEFDEACLAPVDPMDAAAIRALRMREDVSQAVLARHLGVATSTLERWERGDGQPEGPALRLLVLVDRNGLAHLG